MIETEFVVIKGKTMTFEITVKQDGSINPLSLDASDTFTFSLIGKKNDQKYITDKVMVKTSPSEGKVTGTITGGESAAFPVKKAAAEDGFMVRPNMRLIVTGNTLAQGVMTSVIENVYIMAG